MSISITKSPGNYALVHNPVVYRFTSSGEAIVTISVAGYSASFTPDASGIVEIDIAEILQALVASAVASSASAVVHSVYGSQLKAAYTITATGSTTSASASHTGKAIYGAVSKEMLRRLAAESLTPFTYRLANATRNFVLTTRTNGRIIALRETEIAPLVFLSPNKAITLVTERGRSITTNAFAADSVCAINVNYFRQQVWDNFGEIATHISVIVDGQHVFAIVITPGAISDERQIIEFRNSFGCYERIEATGIATRSEQFAEANTWQKFDSVIHDYVTEMERIASTQSIKVEIGYKSPDEFMFLLDMLRSDDQYIVAGNIRRKARITTEDYTIPLYLRTPTTVALVITFTDEESNYSPDFDLSLPEVDFGEWIVQDGPLNYRGLLYSDQTLNYE